MASELSDDGALWTRVQSGDERALTALFDRHQRAVFRHALALRVTAHEADELMVAAFFELWRKRSTVAMVDGSVLPWLLVTATFLFRNRARGMRRYDAMLSRLPRTEGLDPAEDAAPGPAVRPVAPSTIVGTWILPGVASSDASLTLRADGSWSTTATCRVLGEAGGSTGRYRLLPTGFLLVTGVSSAVNGCWSVPTTPPGASAAILRFVDAGSVSVNPTSLTIFDRSGKSMGILQSAAPGT